MFFAKIIALPANCCRSLLRGTFKCKRNLINTYKLSKAIFHMCRLRTFFCFTPLQHSPGFFSSFFAIILFKYSHNSLHIEFFCSWSINYCNLTSVCLTMSRIFIFSTIYTICHLVSFISGICRGLPVYSVRLFLAATVQAVASVCMLVLCATVPNQGSSSVCRKNGLQSISYN